MTYTNEIISRARRVNPVPDVQQVATGDLLAVRLQVDSLRKPTDPARQPLRRRWSWRPLAVAAAAFVLVILLVGAVVLLPSPRDEVVDQPPVPTTATTTTPPTTAHPGETETPGPTLIDPPPVEPTLDLVRVTHASAFAAPSGVTAGVSMTDIAYGRGIWVAVGETSAVLGADNAFVDRAAIWTSRDAESWERVGDHRDLEFGQGPWPDGGSTMVAVTTTASGFVAVGTDVDLDAASNQPTGAVWHSTDGRNWVRVDNRSGVFGDGEFWTEMHDVVADGDVVIAVGEFGDAAAVWKSIDGGMLWSRVDHDAQIFGLVTMRDDAHDGVGDGRQVMLAVTLGHEGFVAAGTTGGSPHAPDGGAGTQSSGVVWQSADGTDWRRIATSGDPFEGAGTPRPTAVVTFADEYFVVGFDRFVDPDQPTNLAAVWRSDDLVSWTPVEDAAFTGAGDAVINAAAADGSRFVAVGQRSVGATSIATLWLSHDGQTWQMHEAGTAETSTFLTGVEFGSNGVVIVGAENPAVDWQDLRAAIWRSAWP
jgi:hypothetical protein